MTRILFIQPHKTVLTSDLDRGESDKFLAERTDKFARVVPSLSAMTVLGALDKQHESYFIDATADNPQNIYPINSYISAIGLSDSELCDKISEIRPEIVLLTSMFSSEYFCVNNISQLVKRKFYLPVVVGGHHAELKPTWHINEGCVDLVGLGEGELNINQIIRGIEGSMNLSEIRGVVYRDASGGLRINPKGILDNLDRVWDIKKVVLRDRGEHRYLPDLVTRNPKLYLPERTTSKGVGVLYASRGCPYGCEYCNATHRDGKSIRHMSLDRMIKISEEFIEIGSSIFHNESDTFGIHPIDREYLRWVGEQRRNNRDISLVNTNSFFAKFFFSDRRFSPERVDLLKDAGFRTLTVSVESFNPKFNRGKLKGISTEMLNECFAYIKQKGLNIDLYMMYLFPEQTDDELKRDIELVGTLSPNLTTTTWRSLTYFPGTTYYDWAIRNGKFTEESYRQMIHEGNSFYHLDKRFNFSRISDPPRL